MIQDYLSIPSSRVKMGPVSCPETSVCNVQKSEDYEEAADYFFLLKQFCLVYWQIPVAIISGYYRLLIRP